MDEIIDVNTLFGPLPVVSSDLAVDSLLGLMEKHGVGAACALSTLGLLLDPNIGNSATRAAIADHPELRPVATLNPMQYFGDTASVLRLKTDGFCMIRLFPAMQGWPIEFSPFRALLRCMDEIALPLMIDIERTGDITQLEIALDAYPTPIILAGVSVENLAEATTAMRHHSNWHLEISRLLAPGCLKQVADTLGADRLLFGTGAPAFPVASALQVLNYAGLSDAARQQILAANARRILNI